MSAVAVEIVIVLALFIANGLFAMSEMAVVSSRKSRLKQMADSGHPGAESAVRLAESPNRFLPTVQIGITLIGLLAGAFSGATLAESLDEKLAGIPALAPYAEALSFSAVVIALAFLSVIVGELAPKRIALTAPEEIACRLARPIEWMSRIAQPFVHFLSAATDLLLRMLRIKSRPREKVSEDEVRLLLHEGLESGVFLKEEPQMVESVLSFDRRPVCEIMTPRAKLVFVSLSDTQQTLWHKVVVSGHSSYPVCDNDRQRILGVISVKAIYANLAAGAPVNVSDLLTPPLFVHPDEPVLDVLDSFKRSGVHIAVVQDDDGCALGLVTLVDVLEAIVGDIPSLEDRMRPEARQRPDGSWLVDGHFDLVQLGMLLHVAVVMPVADDSITVATFAVDQLAGHPREGDSFSAFGLHFEIIDMDRTSVDKVLVQLQPKNDCARMQPVAAA